jgi:hypothetical protein
MVLCQIYGRLLEGLQILHSVLGLFIGYALGILILNTWGAGVLLAVTCGVMVLSLVLFVVGRMLRP